MTKPPYIPHRHPPKNCTVPVGLATPVTVCVLTCAVKVTAWPYAANGVLAVTVSESVSLETFSPMVALDS